MLSRVLNVLAIVAVFTALVIAKNDVHGAGGEGCGSAWRSANRTLPMYGGERTDAERLARADACEVAGERVLRWAAVAGAIGVAAVAGARYAKRRSHVE